MWLVVPRDDTVRLDRLSKCTRSEHCVFVRILVRRCVFVAYLQCIPLQCLWVSRGESSVLLRPLFRARASVNAQTFQRGAPTHLDPAQELIHFTFDAFDHDDTGVAARKDRSMSFCSPNTQPRHPHLTRSWSATIA